ncbi:MAG: translation initiation factor IF-3 [Nitrospirae bacterium]|nr:translation initiation factor IF-3 [Nitrospirota bacterium]
MEINLKVNRQIRAREVRVIGADGEQIGVLTTFEAIKRAEEAGLDLVEVAPTSAPPVCRIMDYGKYRYEQSKKQHVAKVHQRGSQLKEIKLRPRTSSHDMEIKMRNARRFLEERNKAKITLTFRGREMAYSGTGRELLAKFAEGVKDVGQVEHPPKMEGRSMIMILMPRPEGRKTWQRRNSRRTGEQPNGLR